MNPGIFILGGGGGGGGSGAGRGKGGKAKQGANGKNGGKDAKGGGKGAGNCGKGAGAGRCPTHSAKTAAGDPVDIVTGRVYTTPEADLFLPGLIDLLILRSYRTSDDPQDIGMGYGWSHSLAWRVEERRRSVCITTEDACHVLMDRPDVGQTVIGYEAWELTRDASGYILHTGDDEDDGIFRVFVPHPTQPETFILSELRDRNGNRIELRYDRGLLSEIVDSVGRIVRVRHSPEGRVAAFEVKNAPSQGRWIAFATYSYDHEGDLVSVIDADGVAVYFSYQDHRLISQRFADGLEVHYEYDSAGRCVETWADRPNGNEPALSASAPALLADGVTKAKGLRHVKLTYSEDGFTEVVDSVSLRQVSGNEFGKADRSVTAGRVTTWQYNEYGQPLEHVDPLGAVTTFEYDARGNLVQRTDPLGRATKFIRDLRGDIIEVIGPDGASTLVERNAAGNVTAIRDPAGRTTRYVRAPNGLVLEEIEPTGARWQYRYDAHANLVELVDPHGATYQYGYDALGRDIAYRNPEGATFRFFHTDLGRILGEVLPNGGTLRYGYDACGRVIQVTDPDGYTARLRWGGLDWVCAAVEPDGRERQLKYNREGWLTDVWNARGEVWRYEYDVAGNVVAEHTFDGRLLRYAYDEMNRIVKYDGGRGGWIECTYDIIGRPTSATYDDGTTDVFEYDDYGEYARIISDGVEIEIERDAVGQILRERIRVDGKTYTIQRTYDAAGEWLTRAVSTGYTAEVKRDLLGNVIQSTLDGTHQVSHARDTIGRERRRLLPGRGELIFDYNEISRLVRYEVRRPGTVAPTAGPATPAWLGQQGGAVAEKRFDFSAAGLIVGALDAAKGATRYGYDVNGRLIERVMGQGGIREDLGYDETDNHFEANRGLRTYAPGDRLVRHGNTELVWDHAGRLAERRETSGDDVKVTRFEWSARGLLSAVVKPDGQRVEFTYDAFSRRVAKRILKPGPDGKLACSSRVHFLWDGSELLQEIREAADAAGNPVVEERSYYFSDEEELVPVAQRDVKRRTTDDIEEGEWLHFVTDPSGSPEHLVEPDGHIVWSREQTLYGAKESETRAGGDTRLRFRGQYEDDETGLSYNRHRYYDPETGRYISPDPIGLEGGLNLYSYGTNPLNFQDLYALTHFVTAHIEKANGKVVPLGKFDSCQSGSAWNAVKKDKSHRWSSKVSSYKGKKRSGLFSMLSHTEKKVCTKARAKGIGKGDTLVIKGTLPPCSTCKAFMKDLAKQKGCNIKYQYKEGGKTKTWKYPP